MRSPSNRSLAVLPLCFAAACGPTEDVAYEVVASRAIVEGQAGKTLPEGCRPVGRIEVPARKVGYLERFSGAHLEAFYNEYSLQAERLGANYVVPSGGLVAHECAVSGARFVGAAFACPE